MLTERLTCLPSAWGHLHPNRCHVNPLCPSLTQAPGSPGSVAGPGRRAPRRAEVESGWLPGPFSREHGAAGGGCHGRSAVHAACSVSLFPNMQPTHLKLYVIGHAASLSAEGSLTGALAATPHCCPLRGPRYIQE